MVSLEPASGGPARSVPQLAAALIKLGHDVGLWSLLPCPEMLSDGMQKSGMHQFSGSFSVTLTEFGKPDLVHDHGVWRPCHHQVARECARRTIPLIVSPRGMLEPWALQQKRWKKQTAWWLYQRRDLRAARCLHATAEAESKQLRRLGLKQPIALVPNGVELPEVGGRWEEVRGQRTEERDQRSEVRGQRSGVRTALFISRIHPKKGLLNLVAAWSRVRPSGWRMVVCGPDECGHTEQVKRAVAEAGLSGEFEFKPLVYGAEKEALYASADLFILPTFSENFGIAVAEALAAEMPVITTTGAPWEELRTRQCGWWIDIGAKPLAATLREAISLSDQERYEMGRRGRRLVEEKYSWPKIGREMLAVYQWVLGLGPKPECILLKS
jgi:glycosyltransferase involved in cell wall biosynthesis